MEIAVRYWSRGGNTKKLAEAIATAVGVAPETADVPLKDYVDVLFLGSAVYAGGVDEKIKSFLAEERARIGTVYCFSTAAVAPSTYAQIQKIAAENGIQVSDREFHCRGSFLFLHRGRPNEGDQTRAAAFAKAVVEKASG